MVLKLCSWTALCCSVVLAVLERTEASVIETNNLTPVEHERVVATAVGLVLVASWVKTSQLPGRRCSFQLQKHFGRNKLKAKCCFVKLCRSGMLGNQVV